jgi:flagellin-specific chaperone FliS
VSGWEDVVGRLRDAEAKLEEALEAARRGDAEEAGRGIEGALEILRDLILDLEEEELGV